MLDKYLTIAEAAKKKQVAYVTIQNWTRKKAINFEIIARKLFIINDEKFDKMSITKSNPGATMALLYNIQQKLDLILKKLDKKGQ